MPAVLLDHEKVEISPKENSSTLEEFIIWFDVHPIKSRIKKSLTLKKKLRCCYCRGYTDSTNNNEWDIEHILCGKDFQR